MSSKTERKKTILFFSSCHFCCVRVLHRNSLQLGALKCLEEDAKQKKKKKSTKILIYDCVNMPYLRHFGNSLCFCELKLSEN